MEVKDLSVLVSEDSRGMIRAAHVAVSRLAYVGVSVPAYLANRGKSEVLETSARAI